MGVRSKFGEVPPPRKFGRSKNSSSRGQNRILIRILTAIAIVAIVSGASAAWLWKKASIISTELTAATALVAPLQSAATTDNKVEAAALLGEMRQHTQSARNSASDPLWLLATALPLIGPNFGAVTEVARSADDVAQLGLTPLVNILGSLNWDSLVSGTADHDLEAIRAASPSVSSAAYALRASYERLDQIDTEVLLPQVAAPLTAAKEQLYGVAEAVDIAAGAAKILPGMMGDETPRSYLLMVQNNAESRSSGGIPGALAILNVDNGKLTLGRQISAAALGVMTPAVPLDEEQEGIYSSRLGKFMQDVNLTPDFPSAATTARNMWEQKTGVRVDGVISIDPVVLGYVLDATGPVRLKDPDLTDLAEGKLPTELDGRNVVSVLLSDVYADIENPSLQDAYFAGVAQEIFGKITSGTGSAKDLLSGLSKGANERRVLVWANNANEQSVIENYPISGAVAGPSVLAAQFGVYFNDGTGAKMDYFVKRSVQLIKECPNDGYEQATLRVTSTNTAPADAAKSLPTYVTGGGIYGVPAGTVQTNIAAYGPVQAQVETAKLNGEQTSFAPYFHDKRPVGILAIRLAPGESKTVDFTFGKIVQHTEPNVVVTPTVQAVSEVIKPTEGALCG